MSLLPSPDLGRLIPRLRGTVVLAGSRGTGAVARGRARVTVSGQALHRVRLARDVVEAELASGEAVYGLNTGLGSFYRYRIPPEQLRQFSGSVSGRCGGRCTGALRPSGRSDGAAAWRG